MAHHYKAKIGKNKKKELKNSHAHIHIHTKIFPCFLASVFSPWGAPERDGGAGGEPRAGLAALAAPRRRAARLQLLPAGPLRTALSVSEAGRHSLLSPPEAGCGMEALPLPKATASPRLVSQRPAYTLVNGLY